MVRGYTDGIDAASRPRENGTTAARSNARQAPRDGRSQVAEAPRESSGAGPAPELYYHPARTDDDSTGACLIRECRSAPVVDAREGDVHDLPNCAVRYPLPDAARMAGSRAAAAVASPSGSSVVTPLARGRVARTALWNHAAASWE